jgi:DNA topoisomerase-3
MEKGQLSREKFMAEIQAMTEKIVAKAKGYDRDTIPGDYATLQAPCPNCGGIIKENYRRYACTGAQGSSEGCGFSFGKTPAGRTFELQEVEQFLRDRRIGPLDGFRSKAGWPFTAEMVIKFDEDNKNYKLEFDFGDDDAAQTGELVDLSASEPLGPCPKCGASVREHGKNYVCEKSVPTSAQPTPSCDFRSGQIILQQPVERAQMQKLLATGKTDMLDKFVSSRTRRAFKAMLAWDAEAGKVNFEFAPSKYPPRKTAPASAGAKAAAAGSRVAGKVSGKVSSKSAVKPAAKKAVPAKAAARPAAKAPRQASAASLKQPSAALAAVIGQTPLARPQVMKALWDYIKAQGLQDPKDKRLVNADAKLLAVFGKPQANMFELAGLIGKHLG